MIDKFNFYDLYGYLLPGAALLFLLWLPFGLVKNSLPSTEWSSAIIGAALAYIAGYLVQTVSTRVIPSWEKIRADGHEGFPSDVALDQDDKGLSPEVKSRLAELIKTKFKLVVGVDKPGKDVDKALDAVRQDAFREARHVLIRAKEVSYAEQFQGLYTMSRNLAASFALVMVYYSGWALSIFKANGLHFAAYLAMVIGLLLAINTSALALLPYLSKSGIYVERVCAIGLLLACLGAGYVLGRHHPLVKYKAAAIAVFALAALIACFRCYAAYISHSRNFARTIWRDFLASTDAPKAQDDSAV